MRSAAAIVAPVLPAETTASARPSFTRRVATPIAPAQRRGGVLVHPDDAPRVHDVDAGRLLADKPAQPWLVTDEHEVSGADDLSIQQRAPDYVVRGVVAAHGIDGDAHQCRIVLLGRGRAPRLDLDHLPAAIRAAVRTRLVRRLRAAALRARHEVCRAQR